MKKKAVRLKDTVGEAKGLGGRVLSTAVNSGSRRWRRNREEERGMVTGSKGKRCGVIRGVSVAQEEGQESLQAGTQLPPASACSPPSSLPSPG